MLCNFWYYKYEVFHIYVNRIAGNKSDDDDDDDDIGVS
jgi:hypothetical protein